MGIYNLLNINNLHRGGKFLQIGLHGIEQRFSVGRREAAVFLSVWNNT